MNVLMVEPGKAPYETEISDGLEAMQAAVGGNIQAVYPYEDLVGLVCNEEGKLEGLPLNRALRTEDGEAKSTILSPATSLSAVSERKTFAVSRLNLPRSSRRNSSTLKSLSGSRVRSSLSNSLYPATARPKSLKRVLSCNVDVDSGAVFADRAA